MNYVDLGILAVLAAFLIKGLWRGLLREVCALAGLLLGAFFAFRFHAPLGDVLASVFGISFRSAAVIASALLFISTVLFFAILGYLLSRFVRLLFLGGINRVAGGFFGLAEGALLLALVLFTFSLTELPEVVERNLLESQLAPPFVDLGEAAFQQSRRYFAGWR
jgi:membrane protein required for colicin V production